MRRYLVSVFFSLALACIASASVPVSVRAKWGKGMDAKFSIPVHKQFDGWRATITFSTKIRKLEIWSAVKEGCSGKVCTIRNAGWNSRLNPGDILRMNFVARFFGWDGNPTAQVVLHGNDGQAVSTTAPTTRAISSDYQHRVNVRWSWDTGMDAEFNIHVNRPYSGWRATITFTTEIKELEIWNAVKESCSGRVCTIRNAHWNANLSPGDILMMNFVARFTNMADNPAAYIVLHGNGPPPPTTRPPPTTTTHTPSTTLQTPSTTTTAKPSSPTASTTTTKPTSSTTSSTNKPSSTVSTTSKPSSTTTSTTGKPSTSSTTDGPTTSTTAPPVNTKYNYNEVLEKSIMFYEAQRSGKLPTNNRIAWRGDSALQDRGDNGEDLTGGWYDAGDNVKFGFPMAWSTTTLLWGLIEFKDAYQAAVQLEWMYESVKWPLDYFIKAHTKTNEFYGQCGNGHADHSSWVPPEAVGANRPSYKVSDSMPGSELVAETAAAMAAGAIAFRTKDSAYSAELLRHAREMFDFANEFRGKYTGPISDANSFYRSTTYDDELVWAAAWLFRATNELQYLEFAKNAYQSGVPWAYSWDEKKPGYQLLMYQLTREDKYKNDAQAFLDSWLQGGGITYTPKGLAWRDGWGSLRYSANSAFLALVAADQGLKTAPYRQFAESQINYMLGDTGRSFVVGFGVNPPQRPHHRAASCPTSSCGFEYLHSSAPNPHVLHGALVGGPDQWDNYADDRNNHQRNEVATDYNAGFQSAVAGLIELAHTGQLPSQSGQLP